MEYFHFVGPQMAAKLVGMSGLVLAVFVFAGGFIGARLYYDAGGTPADVVALRYGVSAVVMLPFVVAARHRLTPHNRAVLTDVIVNPRPSTVKDNR